jgi:NADH-quinone oxidoreductase subunit K
MSIPLGHSLMVGAALFVLGAVGFLTRRNLITLFLCAELMLQGVALNLVAFASHHGHMPGQVFALFIVTVAACEAGLALALILMLYRSRKSLDVSLWQDLRDPELEPTLDIAPLPAPIKDEPSPVLAVAGRLPTGRSQGGGDA